MVDRRDFSGTVVTNASLALCMAITSILIARFFGPEIRGIYAIITSLINFIVMISLFGTPARLATMYGLRQSFIGPSLFNFSQSFTAVVIISIPVIVLSAPLALSLFFKNENIFLESLGFSFAAVLASYSILRLQLNTVESNWRAYNLARLTFAIVVLLLMFLLRNKDISLFEVVYCIFFGNFLSVAVQVFLSRPLPTGGRSTVRNILELYKSSIHYFFNAVAGASSGYADTLCAALVLSPAAVGFWAVARSFSGLLAPVNSALSATIFSAFARRDNYAITHFSRIFFVYALYNGVLILCLASSASFIMVPVFGSEFSTSISLVPIALVFGFLSSTSELFEERLRGDGRPRPVTVSRGSVLPFYLALYFLGSNDLEIVTFSLVCVIGQAFRLTILAIALREDPKIVM